MVYGRRSKDVARLTVRLLGAAAVLVALCVPRAILAQDEGRDRDRDRDRVTRIDSGTVIVVRTTEGIESDRRDNEIYRGIVDQEVRGEDGRLAILRGSPVELIVRTEPDNDLVIDLESVTSNGERYGIRTEPNRAEARRDDSLVGAIVGAVRGEEVRGREVHIPRGSILTFRLERPLYMGVVDRGIDRNGRHYHDWYPHQDNR
ncbi:MAG TPA: hypothetical protein VGR97_01930 [Candidatus Acidoferrales bacterium]|nr:hypothetical protein [Candidatus Acidoferrales bacterium]